MAKHPNQKKASLIHGTKYVPCPECGRRAFVPEHILNEGKYKKCTPCRKGYSAVTK